MPKREVTRKQVVNALVKAFEPLDYAYSFWEAGAASFDRVDEWSDIDLYLVVKDNHVEDAFKVTEEVLSELGGMSSMFRLPEPTWHGHSQAFYQLKNASPFLFLDYVVMKRSSKDKFLQFAIHERPKVYFDKANIVRDDPIDPDEFLKKIRTRLDMLKTTFTIFRMDTLKELNRGNYIEAFMYYMGGTYRPLLEVLRIKYTPLHFNFGTRYVHYELPQDIVRRLKRLIYVNSPEDLRRCHTEAGEWFFAVLESIDMKEVRKKLGKRL